MFETSENRDRVVHAARGLVRRRGYAGVSLRQIAAAANYSPAGLYTHFSGLKAILDALAGSVRDELGGALAAAAERAGDARSQLVEIGLAYIDFALAHPAEFELLFRYTRSRRKGASDRSPSSFDLLRRIARGIAPEAAADDVDAACLGLWSAAHGLAMLRIAHLAEVQIDWKAWSRRILVAQVEALLCAGQ